jgi:serine phosphatase RsbU (regulator of sigma subunit)
MACNNDGVWNTNPVSYSFSVSKPWWTTQIAYMIYAVLLFVLVLQYVKWRERSLLEKNRLLEQKVQERTAEIERQKENIMEQRDRIAEQRKEIMDSILYAQQIQLALMPNVSRMEQILPDHFLFFCPRDVVSGDYYWATKRGNQSVVVAADCTGHGVPGAFMSMLGISILNEIVLRQEVNTASEILNELRGNLKLMLSQTGAIGEQRDGMDVALCIIDYDAMTVQYAGAYNSLYLVRNENLIEYKANKMPVGIHVGEETDFTNHVIYMEDNDMLYIFSDGYVDQFGGPGGQKFKTKPFKHLLVNISKLPTDRQQERLKNVFEEWKGNNAQMDDVVIIGIKISKTK